MNIDTLTGKVDQLKGEVKQSIGEALGDEHISNSGVADQVKGHAKEAWGATKDAVTAVSADAETRSAERREDAKLHGEEAAHNIRENIVAASEKVKDFITGHADNIKREH